MALEKRYSELLSCVEGAVFERDPAGVIAAAAVLSAFAKTLSVKDEIRLAKTNVAAHTRIVRSMGAWGKDAQQVVKAMRGALQ
jgi:hypothetical protein